MARLFGGYRVEGLTIPYTREEVVREAQEFLRHTLPKDSLLEGFSAEDRLAGATAEVREKLRRLLENPPSTEPKE